MKTDPANPDDKSLHSLLKTWQVEEALPPRFSQQVWHQIAQGESPKRASILGQVSGWLMDLTAQRRLAVSYLTLLLLTGLLSGYWQGRVSSDHTSQSLSSRYVRMMDPYQATHH